MKLNMHKVGYIVFHCAEGDTAGYQKLSMAAKLTSFTIALEILRGTHAMKWWKDNTPEEDAVKAEAADTVLQALSDADFVKTIEDQTGRNLREQISVEQVEELEQERKWYSWGARRN